MQCYSFAQIRCAAIVSGYFDTLQASLSCKHDSNDGQLYAYAGSLFFVCFDGTEGKKQSQGESNR